MKNRFLILLILAISTVQSFSQSVFWSEDFSIQGNVCDPTDPIYGWTLTNIDTQGTYANQWYIYFPVNCYRSDSCSSSNIDTTQGALFVGYGNSCDSALNGAVYRAGCFNATHKQIESPIIDCTGKTNIMLDLDYIAAVFSPGDSGSILFSDDGGSNWITLYSPLNSGYCPLINHLAFWRHLQLNLPSSADNNPIVKLAFKWRNNADCYGSLFSFAIDNVALTFQCNLDVTIITLGDPYPDLCAGRTHHYIVSPVDPTYTYSWNLNGNNFYTGTQTNLYFENPGNYELQITVTDTNGCVDHFDTTLVVEGFDVLLSLDPDTICPTQCIKFDSSVNPAGSPIYNWSFPGGTPYTSSSSDPTSCFTQIGSHTASLTVSDPTNTSCSRTESIQFFVDTCGYPVLTSIDNNLNTFCVCVGTCLDFYSDAYDATAYSWVFPTGNPSGSSSPSPTNICFDTAGSFNIELTITNSTGSATLLTTMTVSDYPPIPTLTYNSGTHSITITNHNPIYVYELSRYDSSSSTWTSLGTISSNPIPLSFFMYLGYSYKIKAIGDCQSCFTESDSIYVPVDN